MFFVDVYVVYMLIVWIIISFVYGIWDEILCMVFMVFLRFFFGGKEGEH